MPDDDDQREQPLEDSHIDAEPLDHDSDEVYDGLSLGLDLGLDKGLGWRCKMKELWPLGMREVRKR